MTPDELLSAREALGWSQDRLAEALGVDVMTVSRWERGVRTIPPLLDAKAARVVLKLAQALRKAEK